MRIAIDISQVVYGTGVSVYTENLVRNLLKIDKKNQYVLLGYSLRRRHNLMQFLDSLKGNFESEIIHLPITMVEFLWGRLGFPKIEKLVGKIDVFHSSDWVQLPSTAFKVTTIHDLSPIKFPNIMDKKIVKVFKRRFAKVLKEVDRCIVPSQVTKNDLVELGFPEEKIRVIYEAPDPIFSRSKEKEIEKIKKKYAIFGDYLLSVGVGARKNTQRIIDSYNKLGIPNLRMIFVGRKNSELRSSKGVIFLGHVPQKDTVALYSGAKALVYPSLYEGFGLPILEAFAVGCPVVTSNISSMLEIAGNAAVLVDPFDIESIVTGIKTAIKDNESLAKKGLERVKDFSWESAAKQTLEVYREAL